MRKIRNILILAIITIITLVPIASNAATRKEVSVTATYYCRCDSCCRVINAANAGKVKQGGVDGKTSSGVMLNTKNSLVVVAADKRYSNGTIFYLPSRYPGDTTGGYMLVCDRGGAIKGDARLDISVTLPSQGGEKPYLNSHKQALKYGGMSGAVGYLYDVKVDEKDLQKYSESQSLLAAYVGGKTVPVPDDTDVPDVPDTKVPEVTADFDIKVNDNYVGKGGTIWAERINKITLVDASSHEDSIVQWRIINKDTNKKYNLGKGKTLDINFSDKSYAEYVSKNGELVIELETLGTKAERIKTITYKLARIPVEANFNVIVTDTNGVRDTKPTENSENGAVVNIWETDIKTIQLVDTSNILGRVEKWQIYSRSIDNWTDVTSATINWTNESYDEYIDVAGYIRIRMETISDYAGYHSEKEIRLNPVRAERGIILKVESNGEVVAYKIQEGQMNEINVSRDSKVVMEGKAVIEYRLWDPNAQKQIIIENGIINNIVELKDSVYKLLEENRYQARIGITRDGGAKEGYDVVINLKDEINSDAFDSEKGIQVKYGEKYYDATEGNPIREGVYLGNIVVKNSTGKAIKEWQLWSQKESKYVTIEGTEDEKLMYLGLENYNKKAHDIYEIKVKAVFEDESEMIRYIYHKMVRIETPTNQQVVSANEDLEIKWNGEKGRKYFVRMVKYNTAEKGNIVPVEIVPGEIVEGSSYIIDKKDLDENACYRIAVKEAEGQYHDIIVISTSDKLEGTIENYNEIKESKEGETVKVELSGREENDKYVLVIYKENGEILKRMEAYINRFEIIRADQAEKGIYKIELSIIRGGITHKANTYTITIK